MIILNCAKLEEIPTHVKEVRHFLMSWHSTKQASSWAHRKNSGFAPTAFFQINFQKKLMTFQMILFLCNLIFFSSIQKQRLTACFGEENTFAYPKIKQVSTSVGYNFTQDWTHFRKRLLIKYQMWLLKAMRLIIFIIFWLWCSLHAFLYPVESVNFKTDKKSLEMLYHILNILLY